jgi:hypothetical protein
MRHRTFLACALAAAIAVAVLACGRGETPDPANAAGPDLLASEPPAPQAIPGVYALDVARTTGGKVTDADGNDVVLSPDVLARVQANHGASQLRIELRPDGTFELVMKAGEEDFRTSGTWTETPAGIEMTTTAINGEAPPPDMEVKETYRREGGHLVSEVDGARVYLKKQAGSR